MIHISGIFILSGFLFFANIFSEANAQSANARKIFSINDNWKFLHRGIAYAETVQAKDADWETVSLPHTWNAADPFDDDRTYRRDIGWYRRHLNVDQGSRDKKIFLYFEGANQVAHVYVNGYFAGMHKGGYTGFSIDITNYINWKNASKNIVAVQVNNAHDPFIPPLNVGYASYGGIYRDAWMVVTDKLHLESINNNSGGVYISTPTVSKAQATVAIKSTIKNESDKEKTFNFLNKVFDANGTEIRSVNKSFTVAANQRVDVSLTSDAIKDPRLWSPDDPYLYKVTSQIIDRRKGCRRS